MTSDLKPSDVLSKAADLIEPEGAWIQGSLAADEGGGTVSPLSEHAVCWCAAGAIARTMGSARAPYSNPAVDVVMRVAPRMYRGDLIWAWNDNRSPSRRNQKRVVTVLRKAAELARSEGQ